MTAMTATLSQVQQQLDGTQTTQMLNTIRTYANSVGEQSGGGQRGRELRAADAERIEQQPAVRRRPGLHATAAPNCSNSLSAGYSQTGASAQSMLSTVQRLSTLLQSAGAEHAVRRDQQSRRRTAQDRADGTGCQCVGRRQRATGGQGVQTLVDQTKQMGGRNEPGGRSAAVDQARRLTAVDGRYVHSAARC